MSSTSEVKICELFTELEDDWRKLYDSAFPANERESESKLTQLISVGRMLYHKTIGKNAEMLCFSMVSLAPDFSFLAYLATDPNQRSSGVGSKHMKRLLELLKEQFPNSEGMLLEIDATNPRKVSITDEEKKIRQRRLAFYRRLGARKLCTGLQFLGPARKSGGSEVELDLLFFSFSNEKLDCHTKKRLVSEIYQRFYCLDPDEPIVTTVMGHFDDCVKHDADCPEEAPDGAVVPAGTDPAVPSAPSVPEPVPVPDKNALPPTAVVPAPPEIDKTAGETPPPEDTSDVVVESDCEVLEKMGHQVDCQCQESDGTDSAGQAAAAVSGEPVPPVTAFLPSTAPTGVARVCVKAAERQSPTPKPTVNTPAGATEGDTRILTDKTGA